MITTIMTFLRNPFDVGAVRPNWCSQCKKAGTLRNVHPDSLWEKWILPALLLTPFWCDSCGTRSYGFSFCEMAIIGLGETETLEELRSSFIQVEEDLDFEELIQEIREAEEKMMKTVQVGKKKPVRVRTRRKPLKKTA